MFTFGKVEYVQRYAKDNLTEYTPKGKADLKKFTDMVTINKYSTVKTGEELAGTANSILQRYEDAKGKILKTSSVPRTATKEAEHLIVVLFARADFTEASFARVKMNKGEGCSVVFSHRTYGKKSLDEMNKWLKAHGTGTEKSLMAMTWMP